MVGESSPIGAARHFDLLLARTGRGLHHPMHDVDGEDPGVIGCPLREVRRHVPQRRADLQHPPGPGMHQQREHGPGVGFAGVAIQRSGDVGIPVPGGELRLAHGQDTGRARWMRWHVWEPRT
jgi:hypothetical protein